MKLFCFFFNIIISPCNCTEFIFMALDQILPIPILMCSRACVLHMSPSPGVAQCCCQKKMLAVGTEDVHCTLCHPTCPSCLGLRPQVFSKPNRYSCERSIWLFGSSTEAILVIREFLLHVSHDLDIERFPGILMS